MKFNKTIKYFVCSVALLGSVSPSVLVAAHSLNSDSFVALIQGLTQIASPPDYTSIQGVGSGSVTPAGVGFIVLSGSTSEAADGGNGDFDGSLSFGAGLGEFKHVGVQLSTNITSVNPKDLADSGSFSLKFGTIYDTAGNHLKVGLSFNGFAGWGDAASIDATTSLAISSKNSFYTDAGNHYSYSWALGAKTNSVDDDIDLFSGVSLGLSPRLSISASNTAKQTNVGFGWIIPNLNKTSLSVTANDVFEKGSSSGVTVALARSFNVF